MDFDNQIRFADYLDIRVGIDELGMISFYHGLVELDVPYTLSDILYKINDANKGCRIVIERNKSDRIVDFLDFVTSFDCVKEVIVKKDWKYLYRDEESRYRLQVDRFYIPFYSGKTFWENIRHMDISTPRRYARKNNPNDFLNFDEDETFVYFFDFYNL